jgi:aspartyl-tRNA synthetase
MMWQISAGLGLALALTLGGFKLYYDKKEAETKAFYLQLEQSIQNQKVLEGTIESQNEDLQRTLANHELVVGQIERLSKENMAAQNEVINIKKSFAKHDLNILSIRKPKLIEKIINRGTGDVLNDLKTITNPNQFDEVGTPSLTSSG